MPNDNVVNFNKARKAEARHKKVIKAAENRVKFGRRKTDKERTADLTKKLQNHLDGHKRDKPKPDAPKPDAPTNKD